MPPPASRLLDVADVAVRLKLSQKTIRRLIERGELPAIRIGRSVRIVEADVTAFIQRRWL